MRPFILLLCMAFGGAWAPAWMIWAHDLPMVPAILLIFYGLSLGYTCRFIIERATPW